jgi:hypothetical protein
MCVCMCMCVYTDAGQRLLVHEIARVDPWCVAGYVSATGGAAGIANGLRRVVKVADWRDSCARTVDPVIGAAIRATILCARLGVHAGCRRAVPAGARLIHIRTIVRSECFARR